MTAADWQEPAPPAPDPRVCSADGGDHDWQDPTSARACGRRGMAWVIKSARCSKCRTRRTVTTGSDGSRSVEDVPG